METQTKQNITRELTSVFPITDEQVRTIGHINGLDRLENLRVTNVLRYDSAKFRDPETRRQLRDRGITDPVYVTLEADYTPRNPSHTNPAFAEPTRADLADYLGYGESGSALTGGGIRPELRKHDGCDPTYFLSDRESPGLGPDVYLAKYDLLLPIKEFVTSLKIKMKPAKVSSSADSAPFSKEFTDALCEGIGSWLVGKSK